MVKENLRRIVLMVASMLAFALVIGVLVFAERPDAGTLVGAALIIASGLCSFARERARARRALASAPAAR